MFGVIYIIKSILDITNFLQEKVSADIRIRIRSDIIAIPVSRPVIRTIIPIATGQLLYNLYFYFKFTLLKFLVNFRSAFFEKICCCYAASSSEQDRRAPKVECAYEATLSQFQQAGPQCAPLFQ